MFLGSLQRRTQNLHFGPTFKMEIFAKIVNIFQSLTNFAKISILDVRLRSEYLSALQQ